MWRRVTFVCVMVLLATTWTYAWPFAPATVKIWDTAVPLGLTPGESVEDPAGLTGHGTGSPTVVTVYAHSIYPGKPSGVSLWNPDTNLFFLYGKTFGGLPANQTPPPPPSSGFPGGVDINRGGGPVLAGGPFGTSFGAGDVWVAGAQNEPVYVLMAGNDPTTGAGRFRSYGTSSGLLPPSGQAFGIQVDKATGYVFAAQAWERRISRLQPPTGLVTMWDTGHSCSGSTCGSPVYVTIDQAGRPYATSIGSIFGDAIIRVGPGADGVLGINPTTGVSDDTITLWPVPTQPAFAIPPLFLGDTEQNPNGLITTDADGRVWFTESGTTKVGRLSGGDDGTLGTPDDQICEYTTAGLLNPQQITTSGSGSSLQALFTEGQGNSVSVLTQADADLASSPNRVCTAVPPVTFPVSSVIDVQTMMFDALVLPLQATISPFVFQVAAVGGSGIARYSPMPNPVVVATGLGGVMFGDAGNGYPSGLTGVYGGNRIAGAYLTGNKVFELQGGAIITSP